MVTSTSTSTSSSSIDRNNPSVKRLDRTSWWTSEAIPRLSLQRRCLPPLHSIALPPRNQVEGSDVITSPRNTRMKVKLLSILRTMPGCASCFFLDLFSPEFLLVLLNRMACCRFMDLGCPG
ncbi:hypothetical protein NL676_033441 [Syzygium grande]|nr:hypothetical protein NL676_033441 [Syzygium grande]